MPSKDRSSEDGTASTARYLVTYAFDDANVTDGDVALRVAEAVARMRRDGVDIEFHGTIREGATREGNGFAATAAFSAPSEGTVALLNWRAGLPASGRPRRERAGSESERTPPVADRA